MLVLVSVGELLNTNPGSIVGLEIEEDNAFKRLFVSFKACISGLQNSC